jgi:cytochrome c5
VNPQADKSVITTSVALVSALVLLATALFMVASLLGTFDSASPEDDSRRQTAVLERIKPIARVSFEEPQPVAETAEIKIADLSGKAVYDRSCAACHTTGAAGSPVIGVREQWESRFAQGLDVLVDHAINGIRAMPARGGNPALTDANIRDSVIYMLEETGFEVATAEEAAPAEEAEAEEVEEVEEAEAETEETEETEAE